MWRAWASLRSGSWLTVKMKKTFSRFTRALHPWPRPRGGPHYSVCHFCDTLHEMATLPEGTAARCTCCGAVLYQNRPASLVRATAFSITALILMVVVHSFPFLVMDAASIRTSLSLASAANELIHQGSPVLSQIRGRGNNRTSINQARHIDALRQLGCTCLAGQLGRRSDQDP